MVKETLLEKFRQFQIRVLRVLYKIDAPADLYLMTLAGFVGLFTGFGAYVLNLIVDGVHHGLFVEIGQNRMETYIPYIRVFFPAAGGLLVGLLTMKFSPEVKGHGIPGVMEAVAVKGGMIRKRVSVLTSINSGLTIGSGGSAGKEGPIVQIGAAIGSSVGQFLRVSQKRLKILVAAGAAAGLAAVFNAPIAGVIFSIEIILAADFSLAVFTPIVIASVISTAVARYLVGSSPLFAVPTYSLTSPAEYPLYLVMGILGGILAVVFIKTLYGVEDFFEERLALPAFLKPALGGLVAGLIAYKLPQLYGFDDSATHSALLEHTGIWILAGLIVAKILATSFTLGSGGTGGLFTPSLFIGAMFGALYGTVMNRLFPGICAPPGAYALVGMGVIVAGTIHAPLSAFLIIFEITGDYQIILPLMVGTVAATITARGLLKESIYTMRLSHISKRVLAGRNRDVLENKVIEPYINTNAEVFYEHTPVEEIIKTMMESSRSTFPVLNRFKQVVGIITMRDLRPIIFDRDVAPLLVATDIMSENIFVLEPGNTLGEALRKMEIDDYELLPVVESEKTMQFMGTISRDEILRRYTKENLLEMEKE
ncbi:MAG: chloride channel protein [Calditrichaeota bacterium]|nr:MAG: chloride channel protein [Calditrichota bacterium]